jgi:hypothetical protein
MPGSSTQDTFQGFAEPLGLAVAGCGSLREVCADALGDVALPYVSQRRRIVLP